MRTTQLFIALIFATGFSCKPSEQVFTLDGRQSMILTGKGPGQDGAINPFGTQDSYAVVKNIGENTVTVRIQSKGEVVSMIDISPKASNEVLLKKGHELYLDADFPSKAKVFFKKIE
jgi:hypothetical protein